ncbi:hypothetical protein RQP46_007242 [Phenoliferia psychrophenolica]
MSLVTAPAHWNQPVSMPFGSNAFVSGAPAVVAAATSSSSSKRGREDGHASGPSSSKQKVNEFSPAPTFGQVVTTFFLNKSISRDRSQETYRSTVREHLAAIKSSSSSGWLSEQVRKFDVYHYHYVVDADYRTIYAISNEAGQLAREDRERKQAKKDEAARDATERRSAKVLKDVREDLMELKSKVGRRDSVIKDFDAALDKRKGYEDANRSFQVLIETLKVADPHCCDHPKLQSGRTVAILAYQLTARRGRGGVPLFAARRDFVTGAFIAASHTPKAPHHGYETTLYNALLLIDPLVIKASTHAVIWQEENKQERHLSAHPHPGIRREALAASQLPVPIQPLGKRACAICAAVAED